LADFITCSSCGFPNKTKKKQCSECGNQLTILIAGTGQVATFIYKDGAFHHENGKNVGASKKLNYKKGDLIHTFSIGKAIVLEKSPDKIELQDNNKIYLGHFQIIELDLLTFECALGSFKLDIIGTIPFKIVDPNGQEVLSLVRAPEYDKRFGTMKGYTLTSSGIVNHNVSLLIAMTVLNFTEFSHYLKPSTGYAFTLRKKTFYDHQDNVYAEIKAGRLSPSNAQLISATGEILGIIKADRGILGNNREKLILEIPRTSWIGSLAQPELTAKLMSSTETKIVTGILTTPTDTYHIKNARILEDETNNRSL